MSDSDLAAYFSERRHPRGGGRRRRFIMAHEAAVWIPEGRWGPKRVRTEGCVHVVTAESVYDLALRDDKALAAGDRFQVSFASSGRTWQLDAELRPNAVWRHGRLFLECPHCGQRATRLYVPVAGQDFRCRRCWGLTYESRQARSYKDSYPRGLPALFGSLRDFAHCATEERRERRREASAMRWAERRDVLKSAGS